VYKLIYKELLAYISLYMVVNLIYRELLVRNSECDEGDVAGSCRQWKQSRELFESLRTYCHEQLSSIPLTFVLGFYVSLIVTRWWNQYSLLPWPDSMAMYTAGFLTGKEERQRLMRRNIIRYVLLSYCMTMRAVSFRVKKRFPDLQHLVDAGLMREDELKVILDLEGKVSANKWFLPLVWATDICARALAEGNVRPQTVKTLVGELIHIRENLTGIINHDWVSVPLVYTQVVTLAVYSYFAAALIGAQWISPQSNEAYKDAYGLPLGSAGAKLDLFYPFFLTIQFAFFFGWLKVAETLINPFGEDDDDFELNRLIDRHIQVGYLIVEHDECPQLLQDKYWDECIPKEIPYTVGAEKYKKDEFIGSAEKTLKIEDCDKVYGDIYNMYNSRAFEGRGVPSIKRNGIDYHSDNENLDYMEYGDYEDVGTPIPSKVSWLARKMGRLDSVRSNKSSSSSSTYIYGNGLTKKPLHKSQLSLYDKISRKISLFDNHSHKGEGRSRKSSRQRSVSDTAKPKNEEYVGVENKSFEKEDETTCEDEFDEEVDIILDKKLLETISENQNSPYSTQASHNTSRRMSAQSLFGEPARRGSIPKEPFNGPVMELFHENEIEEDIDRVSRSRSQSTTTESLTGSHRSRESGVGSLADTDTDTDLKSKVIDKDVPLAVLNPALETEVSRDSAISVSAIDSEEIYFMHDLPVPNEEVSRTPLVLSSNDSFQNIVLSEHGSPSPSLPKRKPVMSLSKIEETMTSKSTSNNDNVKSDAFKDDVGSPFEVLNTVYV